MVWGQFGWFGGSLDSLGAVWQLPQTSPLPTLRPKLDFFTNLAVISLELRGLGRPPGEFPLILRSNLAFSPILAVIFS